MQGINNWTFYPRASQGFGPIGPKLSERALFVNAPQQIVSKHPGKALDFKVPVALFNRTGQSANNLRDVFYLKVSGPQPYFLPDLQPSANFSLPTGDRNTKPIHLGENLDLDTKDLTGIDLLNAMMRYIKKTDVFKLDAKEFQNVLDTGDRLRLSPDSRIARLKANYNQDLSDDDFFKLELWLLSTEPADPNIKRGYVRVEPGGAMIPVTQLLPMLAWDLQTQSRTVTVNLGARVGAPAQVVRAQNVIQDEEKKQQGIAIPGFRPAPDLASGRDGQPGSLPRTPFTPSKEFLDLQKRMSARKLQLQGVLDAEEVPEALQGSPAQFPRLNTDFEDILLSEEAKRRLLESEAVQPRLLGLELSDRQMKIVLEGWPEDMNDYYALSDENQFGYIRSFGDTPLNALILRLNAKGHDVLDIYREMKRRVLISQAPKKRSRRSATTVKKASLKGIKESTGTLFSPSQPKLTSTFKKAKPAQSTK
jgi:hypothetical protein